MTAPTAQPSPSLHHVECLNPSGLHRVAYWQWGNPANPQVLVCVHGLSRQGRDFDTLAQALCHRFRVVSIDVAGRGESDWLPNAAMYQVPQYVADSVTVLAALQATGAQQFDWLGTSMGGLIGMGVASMRPRALRKLILNDVGPRLDAAALTRIGTYVGADPRFATYEEARDHLWKLSQTFGSFTPEQWDALSRPMLRQDPAGGARPWKLHYDPAIGLAFKAVTPELAAAGEAQLWQRYDAIAVPTLLVRGAQSDLLSRATADDMARRGPRARLVEFEGVGHAPMFVAPEQIQAVADFLMA
jgi:pimeloyl-ACP methyl ester carboxylesterase